MGVWSCKTTPRLKSDLSRSIPHPHFVQHAIAAETEATLSGSPDFRRDAYAPVKV